MMLQALWDVAPPLTWVVLAVAATFLLTGFVLVSHTLVRSKAYGDRYTGLTHPGRLEWTVRVGIGCLAAGFGMWAWKLAAPWWVLVLFGAIAAVGFGLEGVALARRAD